MIKYDRTKYFNITQFPQYKLNYWAVPKCGCTAIKAGLVKQKVFDESVTDYRYIHHHPSLTYITPEYAEINGLFNFSVIRHPYRRMLALYKHFALRDTERCKELIPDINLARVHNLTYFIEKLIKDRDLEHCNHHYKPIYTFLCDQNYLIIPNIIYDFDTDLYSIEHLLNAHGCKLQRANVSNIDVALNRTQKSLIAKHYWDDFNLFNYEE
jgi:hypothetical protein